jgi:hypothetical protein
MALSPAWAAIPIVGMAVAAVTMTLSKMTQRLGQVTCWTCGADLSGAPESVVGVVCEECGAINQHRPITAEVPAEDVQAWARLASRDDENETEDHSRA